MSEFFNDSILIIENTSIINGFSFISYISSINEEENIKKIDDEEYFTYKDGQNRNYFIKKNSYEINKYAERYLKNIFKRHDIIIFFYNKNDNNYFELLKTFLNNNFQNLKFFNSPLIILIENEVNEHNQNGKESYVNLVDMSNEKVDQYKIYLINKFYCYFFESSLCMEDDKNTKINIFNNLIKNYPIIKLFKNSNCNYIYKSINEENGYSIDITIIGATIQIDELPYIISKNNNSSFDEEGCFNYPIINNDIKFDLLIHKIKLEELIAEENIINLETHGIIYVCLLEDQESFEYIKKYINIILCTLGNVPFIIVGLYTNDSNYSAYESKIEKLKQNIFKKRNIISYILNINEIKKQNNLIFNDNILNLVNQILNKYPIYKYDEFKEPELFLNEKANSIIEDNKENNNKNLDKLIEEYKKGETIVFTCPNCLNPYYTSFNEELGLIFFKCLKCFTIPECYNLKQKKDSNIFKEFHTNQNNNFINYKNNFFNENDKLYNYFCLDCQEQIFIEDNNNHIGHEGICYNFDTINKIYIKKRKEFENEEKFLLEIKDKFKLFISELEEKFNSLYSIYKKINDIKKEMLNSLKVIQNNYIIVDNIKKLNFMKGVSLDFEGIYEPEDKMKKLFEYISDIKPKDKYNQLIIKNFNFDTKLKNKEKNIINDNDNKNTIKDLCSFKYKNKNYINLCYNNDIFKIYDEGMNFITDIDLSDRIQGIKSLFSYYNYSKENNIIYMATIGGIKKITVNNKTANLKGLNNIKIIDEFIEKDSIFEYYIKYNKDISLTTTENMKLYLLINDEKNQIVKKDFTHDIINDKKYIKTLSLEKIKNNLFIIKFLKEKEELNSLKKLNKINEIHNEEYLSDLSFDNENVDKSEINIYTTTILFKLDNEEKLDIKIKKIYSFPDNYNVLGLISDNNILIQCNNPHLFNELILFDINNLIYTKKYIYKDTLLKTGQLYMISNSRNENLNNFILMNKELKIKINIFFSKSQEIMKLNQNLNINYEKNTNNKEEISYKNITKIIKINNRIIGLRENTKNENTIFLFDLI